MVSFTTNQNQGFHGIKFTIDIAILILMVSLCKRARDGQNNEDEDDDIWRIFKITCEDNVVGVQSFIV